MAAKLDYMAPAARAVLSRYRRTGIWDSRLSVQQPKPGSFELRDIRASFRWLSLGSVRLSSLPSITYKPRPGVCEVGSTGGCEVAPCGRAPNLKGRAAAARSGGQPRLLGHARSDRNRMASAGDARGAFPRHASSAPGMAAFRQRAKVRQTEWVAVSIGCGVQAGQGVPARRDETARDFRPNASRTDTASA